MGEYRGNQRLGDATREISAALTQLSDDVKGTIQSVIDGASINIEP